MSTPQMCSHCEMMSGRYLNRIISIIMFRVMSKKAIIKEKCPQ